MAVTAAKTRGSAPKTKRGWLRHRHLRHHTANVPASNTMYGSPIAASPASDYSQCQVPDWRTDQHRHLAPLNLMRSTGPGPL